MTSRILLSCILETLIERRTRRDDGRVFGVATVRDTDRFETRSWTVFVNDHTVLEQFEKLKINEPIAIAGPFNVRPRGAQIAYQITAHGLIGVRRQRKTRGAQPELQLADPDDAPQDSAEGRPFDDAIPF